MTTELAPAKVRLSDQLGPLPEARIRLGDGNSTWDKLSREQMRAYAAQEVAAERGRLASKFMAMAKDAHDAGHYSKRDELSACAGWVLKA